MPHMRISRTHLAAIYLQALRNEIAIDIDGYRAVKAEPKNFGYLPRFSSVWPRLGRHAKLSSIATRLVGAAWKRGLYLLFFTGQFLSLRIAVTKPDQAASNPTLHILLSALAPQLIANADGKHGLAFTVPWQAYPNGVPNERQISLSQILSQHDLWECLIDAIAITRRITRRNTPFRRWHLQTYTLFRWICVARALEKVKCNRMIMANHYDRWAILIDRLGGLTDRHVEIAQHGIEEIRYLPTKLQFVDTINVFDANEEALFKEFILSRSGSDRVRVCFMTNSIELSGVIGQNGSVVVVLVGHPEYDDTQIRFLRAAQIARPDARFIYKAHPTARGINSSIRKMTEIWNRKDTFPKADFVFSYPSTLGKQYANAGIATYTHEKEISEAQLSEAILKIPSKPLTHVTV